MTHEERPAQPTISRHLLTTLRPQVYGNGAPHGIQQPLVEPLWTGIRALAAVDGEGAVLVDASGAEQQITTLDAMRALLRRPCRPGRRS